MKLLIPLLLTLNSFAQTGKVVRNGALQISFETTNGTTLAEIINSNQVKSRIDYKVNGELKSAVLEHGERVKLIIQFPDFTIEAINHDTFPGSPTWLKADSKILAEGIGAKKKTRLLPGKLQCDDFNTVKQ